MIQLAPEIKFIVVPLNSDWNFDRSILITGPKKMSPQRNWILFYFHYLHYFK